MEERNVKVSLEKAKELAEKVIKILGKEIEYMFD